MKANKKDQDFKKLLERVIMLKDNLYGVGNWKKDYLPTDIDGCKSYIAYCNREFNIVG